MNLTLFGFPQTGKTTFFHLLTGTPAEGRGFDGGKREPSVRTLHLPDGRLDRLAAVYPDKKKVAAAVEVTDLAGISFGEVKTSLLLGHLRKADGLVHVVRAFRSEDLPAPEGGFDPARDIGRMEEELVLADLVLVEGRLERLDRDLKKMKDAEAEKERDLLRKLRPALESAGGLRDFPLAPSEEKLIRSFALLSLKPLVHVVNLDDRDLTALGRPETLVPGLEAGRRLLAFSGRIEAELAELDPAERAVFMAEYGLPEPSAGRFAREAAALFGRVTFLTVGKQEVRAWVVRRGAPALEAAGVIHTDIAKGFIRAEVIAAEELLRLGSWHHAKEAGAVRLEGKEYAVQDGDVVYFRFGS